MKMFLLLVAVCGPFLVGCGSSSYEYRTSYKGPGKPWVVGGVTILRDTGDHANDWSRRPPKRNPDERWCIEGFGDRDINFSRNTHRTIEPLVNPFTGETKLKIGEDESVYYNNTPSSRSRNYYSYDQPRVMQVMPLAPVIQPPVYVAPPQPQLPPMQWPSLEWPQKHHPLLGVDDRNCVKGVVRTQAYPYAK